MKRLLVALVLFNTLISNVYANESQCFGSVSNGYLINGTQLPSEGKNFYAYSNIGVMLGRNYVHSTVAEIVLAAYKRLESSAPQNIYVYGETGWSHGGRIRPHKTHRNGTSVDFMVPVVDATGKPTKLPTDISHKFGYNIEFDNRATFENLSIDFESMAEHLYQLDTASKAAGYGITQVIFEPHFIPKLYETKRGNYIKAHIHFMQGNAWVRHDEHYHVDFAIPCHPI